MSTETVLRNNFNGVSFVEPEALEEGLFEPGAENGLMDLFLNTVMPQTFEPVSEPQTAQNNSPNEANTQRIQEAVKAQGPSVVRQDKPLPENAQQIAADIRGADRLATQAAAQMEELKPQGNQAGANAGPEGPGSAAGKIATTVAGNAIGKAILPAEAQVVAAVVDLISGVSIAKAALGAGSYGDTSGPSEFKSGVKSPGYGASSASSAPVSTAVNAQLSQVPGVSNVSSADLMPGVAYVEDTLPHLKIGGKALEECAACITDLRMAALEAQTALNVRADKGTTMGVEQTLQELGNRDLKPADHSRYNPASGALPVFGNVA